MFTCYFNCACKHRVAVFCAEDNVIPKFIDLVTISLNFHIQYDIMESMVHRKSKSAQRREDSVHAVQQRTLILSLALNDEQYEIFTRLATTYNRVWGSLVSWCERHHSTNRSAIQKAMYHPLRERFPELPAQFICIAMRDACGAMKAWNSNYPKRRWNMKASRKRLTINYDLRVMALRGNMLTLSTFHGVKRARILLPELPSWFTERYPERTLNAAKLIIGTKLNDVRIALIYRIPNKKTLPVEQVLGVDLGVHALYTDSEGGAYSSKHVHAVKRRYAHNRAVLQKKSTRSAHRRLQAMSKREERFVRNTNHCVSKQLAATPNATAIAFEDLTYIRRQARKHTKTGKQRRTLLNQWSFSQLQEFTTYKAAQLGKRIIMVDPSYTSQTCNRCGYTDVRNRNHARFDCLRCHYSANADYNAACNIKDRALQTLE